MTQIFFYHGAADRISAAAALIGKAYMQRKALMIFAPDRDLAGAIDRQLWIHPTTAFIPHVRGDSALAGETPILITDTLETAPQNERLVNLSDEIPPGFSRFSSLIEVVGSGDGERHAGRERARFYKDRGYSVRYFDLTEKSA